jgi:hypothetical protein
MDAMGCRNTLILTRHIKNVHEDLRSLLPQEVVMSLCVKKKVQAFLGTINVKPVDPNQCDK